MQRPRRDDLESAPRTRSASRPHALSIIVLSSDTALLATLQEAAGHEHQFFQASSIGAAVELLLGGHCGILIIDVALVGSELARLTEKLQAQFPEVVLLATGRRNEQHAVASLVTSGRIYRFLHKPVSPARAELFLSAAVRRSSELHQQEARTASSISKFARRRALIIGGVALAILLIGAAWIFWPRNAEQPIVQPQPAPSSAPPLSATNDAQLQPLLAHADAAYRSGNLLPPASGNALEGYRSALAIDPTNADARAGIERIVGDAARRVSAAIAAQDAPRATNELKALNAIAPNDSRIDTLQRELIALARSVQAKQAPSPPAPGAIRPTPRPAARPATRTPAPQRTPNLEISRAFLAANKLIEPVDANALVELRKARVAGEDPGAVQIVATDLGKRLLNRALAAVNATNLPQAKSALDAAQGLDREFETSLPDLEEVAARVRDLEATTARAAVRDGRLAHVATLRTNGQLLEPASDNAYQALKQLLAEGAATPEIRLEQQRLASALLDNTRTSLAAGDIDRADVLATRAEEIQPGLPQTKVLREQIGSARTERDERGAVLQAASLPRRRQIPAVYPRDALLNKTEGWVDLEFVISTEGVPSDVKVKAAHPVRVFDTAAVHALRQWRFEPIVRNGAPQSRRAALRMEFKLTG